MTSVITTSELLGKTVNVYGSVDEPLFLASDVADILRHSSVTMMCRILSNNTKKLKVYLHNQIRECNFITCKQFGELLSKQRKIGSNMIESIKHDLSNNFNIHLPVFVCPHVYELEFHDTLFSQLKPLGIKCVYQYRCNKYRIDFYIPEVNLAIEYDEAHHLASQNSNSDRRREQKIKDSIGCEFLRLSFKNSHIENSALAIAHIMKLKYIQKQNVIDLNSNELSILADGVSMARKILDKN